MSRYLYFNTADRNGGIDAGDCYFETRQGLGAQAYYFTLANAAIPIVFYPISTTRGNYELYLQEDGNTGSTFTVSITTDRNYNAVTFAVELTTQLNAVSGKTYTVNYDSDYGRLDVTVSAGTFRFVDGPNSAHVEVGYDLEDTAFHSTGFRFAYPIDVSGTKYIDVTTNIGVQKTWNSTGTFPVTHRIMCVASFGEVLQFENPYAERHYYFEDADRVEISLRDDRGALIRFGNNHNCTFSYAIWPKQ